MSNIERSYVEFADGTRWYAKPYERPCVCIEGIQKCAYHGAKERGERDD